MAAYLIYSGWHAIKLAIRKHVCVQEPIKTNINTK